MKFVLLVESETEQKVLPSFLKRWIDPQLSQPVSVVASNLGGWSTVVNEAARRTHLLFSDKRQCEDIIAVIGLIDLYGPNNSGFYPKNVETVEDRIAWAKLRIERQVNHEKFRQFFAVHEIEAWLLSSPGNFPTQVRDALPARVQHPETVNFDSPPKKLLTRLYRERLHTTYREIVDGISLFGKLEPALAYNRCPALRNMLDEMLALAKAAGL